MNTNEIKAITKELYDISYTSEFFKANRTEYISKAEELINKAGWDDTFSAWFEYLINNCKTAESVINFVHLYRGYDDFAHMVPNPYEFLGFFYFILELNPSKYDATDNMDEMTFEILMKAGIKKDLWMDDSYIPEKDPEIIKAVEDWKRKLSE